MTKSGYFCCSDRASSRVSSPPMSLASERLTVRRELAEGIPYVRRVVVTVTKYASCFSLDLIKAF